MSFKDILFLALETTVSLEQNHKFVVHILQLFYMGYVIYVGRTLTLSNIFWL